MVYAVSWVLGGAGRGGGGHPAYLPHACHARMPRTTPTLRLLRAALFLTFLPPTSNTLTAWDNLLLQTLFKGLGLC